MGKVVMSSLGEILSLRYPRDVRVGSVVYHSMAASVAQERTVWVSCRHETKEPPAAQKALETVQVGDSLRKSKTAQVMRTNRDASEPLKEVMDRREKKKVEA